MAQRKMRGFHCDSCSHEYETFIEDAEIQEHEGTCCSTCGNGTLKSSVGRVNLSGTGGKTNHKITGWFADKTREMKARNPHGTIGTGAADASVVV